MISNLDQAWPALMKLLTCEATSTTIKIFYAHLVLSNVTDWFEVPYFVKIMTRLERYQIPDFKVLANFWQINEFKLFIYRRTDSLLLDYRPELTIGAVLEHILGLPDIQIGSTNLLNILKEDHCFSLDNNWMHQLLMMKKVCNRYLQNPIAIWIV